MSWDPARPHALSYDAEQAADCVCRPKRLGWYCRWCGLSLMLTYSIRDSVAEMDRSCQDESKLMCNRVQGPTEEDPGCLALGIWGVR